MWSLKAREIMLNAIYDAIKGGAVMSFYVGSAPLFEIDMPAPVADIEGAALVFRPVEALSTKNGTPTRATISADGVELLDLPIPDVLKLEPGDIIEGSIIRVKKLIIQ